MVAFGRVLPDAFKVIGLGEGGVPIQGAQCAMSATPLSQEVLSFKRQVDSIVSALTHA